MRLIHMSDLHLTIPGELMAGLDTHARLARALATVRDQFGDAARLILTGDLAHWGERAAYEALKAALAEMPMPTCLMIGNHDNRARFLEVFPEQPTDTRGFVNHAETLGDTRLIYLDTVEPLTHAGHFGADRLAWLENELAAARHARLFLHHNPMVLGLPAMDKIGLTEPDRSDFADVIRRYAAKIDHIHFGHVHAQISGTYMGIAFTSVPSTGHQALVDPTEPDWLKGAPMQPWFHVIEMRGRDTIVQPIAFDWDGPIQTSGTEWDDWAKPEEAVQ